MTSTSGCAADNVLDLHDGGAVTRVIGHAERGVAGRDSASGPYLTPEL